MISQHKDLTNQHNYLTRNGKRMPPYFLCENSCKIKSLKIDCLLSSHVLRISCFYEYLGKGRDPSFEELRNESNIFSVDRGINQKRTENFCNNALCALM